MLSQTNDVSSAELQFSSQQLPVPCDQRIRTGAQHCSAANLMTVKQAVSLQDIISKERYVDTRLLITVTFPANHNALARKKIDDKVLKRNIGKRLML